MVSSLEASCASSSRIRPHCSLDDVIATSSLFVGNGISLRSREGGEGLSFHEQSLNLGYEPHARLGVLRA